mmetsp:Transcript_1280/g.3117  ORF Transcript_1280/g.3117 Transcript_1280/m.3117 type:complete len:350 (-) Transcript_1280:164-1213(-)
MAPEITERVLVTGGQGFLGAYVIRELLRRGAAVTLIDLTNSPGILEQVLTASEISNIGKVFLDITNGTALTEAVLSFRPTAIIHLAGVQIPTVKANPVLGAAVNVTGTVNVFEAVRALAAAQGKAPIPVSYASSAAVLGPSSDYKSGSELPAESDYHKPRTLYGVFKLCNEGTARIYWQDHAIPSVGLRPLTVFGVGREIGLTSGPTKAIKAAVLGREFALEVSGTTGFQYVVDVARLFIDATVGVSRMPGAHVCGLKGHVVSVERFLQEAASCVPTLAQLAWIKPGAAEVPIHGDVDEAPLKLLTGQSELHMPLSEAVSQMVTHFQDLSHRGVLHDRDLGPAPVRAKL